MADPSAPLPSENTGLPPVVPPSGRFIAQLFFLPLLIVTVAISIMFGFYWFVRGARTPQGYLDGLRDVNPEVRWRAATDLAQVPPRASGGPRRLGVCRERLPASSQFPGRDRRTGEVRRRRGSVPPASGGPGAIVLAGNGRRGSHRR